MKKHFIVLTFVVILSSEMNTLAEPLSIYEIQCTTDANGTSEQHGIIVDCLGGIVTHKREGGRPRLVLQDPNYPDGWSAIQVKGWARDAFDDVNIGDWVSVINVLVEDNKGTTFLQYIEENNPGLTITSINNPLPEPLVVTIDGIAAPIEGLNIWTVTEHSAEKYESMLIKVVDVTVIGTGYGKAYDNYILQSNADPNLTCWVSDYMNNNKDSDLIYHPLVEIDQKFCGVTGILEQYTAESDGIYYDYYQFLTTNSEDFMTEQIADFDGDCDADFSDFSILAGHWLEEQCGEPVWCSGADFAQQLSDGIVDVYDLREFALHWLEGK